MSAVVNVHRRRLIAPLAAVGALIETLASEHDRLWPRKAWPPMVLDRPLAVGARGGHGPIGYRVEARDPGRSVRFRFTAPAGFEGWHGFSIVDAGPTQCVIEHRLEMRLRGLAHLSWPLLYRPLHDALIEDALAQAQAALGNPPQVVRWSIAVRFLRWLVTRGRARGQRSHGHDAASGPV